MYNITPTYDKEMLSYLKYMNSAGEHKLMKDCGESEWVIYPYLESTALIVKIASQSEVPVVGM